MGFTYSSVVYQGGDTYTVTDTSADTYSSQGTANQSSSVQNHGFNGGVYAASAASGVDSATQSVTGTSTTTESSTDASTDTSTHTYSFYEEGQYASGSFSLSSVASDESDFSQYTYHGGDTTTNSGQATVVSNGDGNGSVNLNSNFFREVFTTANTFTAGIAETSTDSFSGSGGDSWSLHQEGSYSNFSYNYQTVIYQSSDSYTESSAQTDTNSYTETKADSRTAGDSINGYIGNGPNIVYGTASISRGDNASLTLTGQDTATDSATSTDSSSFYQSGSFSFGSYSLTSVAYGESYSDSYSDTNSESMTVVSQQTVSANFTLVDTGNFDANNGCMTAGAGQTLTDLATTTGTDTLTTSKSLSESGGDSWSLSEQGSYSNFSYNLDSLVYTGTETAASTFQISETDTYHGSYTGGADGTKTSGQANAMGQNNTGNGDTSTVFGNLSISVDNSSGFSITDGVGQTYTFNDTGSYAGGSYAYGFGETASASDSFTRTDFSSRSETYTLVGSTTANTSFSSGSGANQSNSFTNLSSSTNNAAITYTVAESQDGLSTMSGNDSSTQATYGTYANSSYALSSWVDSAAETASVSSQQTSTMSLTLTAVGSMSSGSNSTAMSQFATYGEGGHCYSVTTITQTWGNSSNGSFSGTISAADTRTLSQAGTFTESTYEAGTAANGSYAMSSMVYSLTSTTSSTNGDATANTITDSITANQTQTASHLGGNAIDSYSGANVGSATELDTITSGSTNTTTAGATYSLYESGDLQRRDVGAGELCAGAVVADDDVAEPDAQQELVEVRRLPRDPHRRRRPGLRPHRHVRQLHREQQPGELYFERRHDLGGRGESERRHLQPLLLRAHSGASQHRQHQCRDRRHPDLLRRRHRWRHRRLQRRRDDRRQPAGEHQEHEHADATRQLQRRHLRAVGDRLHRQRQRQFHVVGQLDVELVGNLFGAGDGQRHELRERQLHARRQRQFQRRQLLAVDVRAPGELCRELEAPAMR